MVKSVDIMDAINRELVKAWPKRTVYVDVCPVDFKRPSFWIQEASIQTAPANANMLTITAYFTVTCIDEVDKYYHTKSRRLLADQQAVMDLFRGETIQVGDRILPIRASNGGRDNDMAFVDLQLEFVDERTDQEPQYETMGEVSVNMKEVSYGVTQY